ncbi:acyl-CoA carboxylase subunit epsilon [Rhodococcus fascians]|nr:acyl-CoA carboxylase subunit epsilon [Rhodococcus fascians]
MSGEANQDALSNANHAAVNEANPVAVSDEDAATEAGGCAASPEIRVVKGNPSDEDLAALVAVLTAAQGESAPGQSGPPELWGSPTLLHRRFAAQSAYSYAASGRHQR